MWGYDREAFCKGDCTLLKLSLFQNGFTCSQNTLTASHRFKGLSLENHLLIDGRQRRGYQQRLNGGWGVGWMICDGQL